MSEQTTLLRSALHLALTRGKIVTLKPVKPVALLGHRLLFSKPLGDHRSSGPTTTVPFSVPAAARLITDV